MKLREMTILTITMFNENVHTGCTNGLPSPAPLVFTPEPPEKSRCLNCEAEMTPDHQCVVTDNDSDWEDIENERDLYPTLDLDSEKWVDNFTNSIRRFHESNTWTWLNSGFGQFGKDIENAIPWRPSLVLFRTILKILLCLLSRHPKYCILVPNRINHFRKKTSWLENSNRLSRRWREALQ